MACPLDANTGFIKIKTIIQQNDLNFISVNDSPLSLSLAPRTTIPSLIGNRIDETTDNICRYKSDKFTLSDVQITELIHEGYKLPGNTSNGVAELIISFKNNTPNPSDSSTYLTGILLCFPIYESNVEEHSKYITQLLTNNQNETNKVSNLEALIYDSKNDKSQVSLAYKTCFETSNSINTIKGINSHTMYVIVFPNGIYLNSQNFQKLRNKIKDNDNLLPKYNIPSGFRQAEDTVKSYKINEDGDKIPLVLSNKGVIYTNQIDCFTEDFKNRFEYFLYPPRIPTSSGVDSLDKCPYYKTTQYKCVPLNQLTDLSGNYVIPGNKTLDTILKEKQDLEKNQIQTAKNSNVSSLSTDDVIGITAGIVGASLAGILLLKVISKISEN